MPFLLSATPHPPLDLHRGHVTFPARLCLCVCLPEREKEREVPASLTKDSPMHSCWKMKLQVKAISVYIFFPHASDRAVCLWVCFTVGLPEDEWVI